MVNIANQLIPHFPQEYTPQNSKAIDFCDGLVACATGYCVHFAFFKDDNQLTRAYSFPISTYPITTLKFHPSTHRLAVGNSIGTLFLFDIHKRAIIARATNSNVKDDDPILSLEWHNDELFTLYSSQKLASFSYSPTFSDSSNKQLSHFVCLWSANLPAPHSRMSVDPHYKDRILFSGSGATFSVYKLSETGGPPSPLSKLVTLNGAGDQINDAIWSLHLPNYIFLLTDTELFIFDTITQGITSVTQHQRSASSFSSLMQFPTNDKKLLIFHKSGTVSVLTVRVPPYSITFSGEILYKHRHQTYANFTKDPGNDNVVILWFVPMGLCSFDITKERIVSMCPLFTSGITSFDTDGISIVYGTKKGDVIYCDLFDTDRVNVFNVSSDCSPVTFVSLCPARNRIYWNTSSRIGIVDLNSRRTNVFSSRASPVTKAVGSFQGCLIVQRAPSVLGIFVGDDSAERPILLTKQEAVDFCFNEMNASFDEGEFAILQENKEVTFYRYTSQKVVPSFRLQGAFSAAQTPTCVAWRDETVVVGTSEGGVYSYRVSSTTSTNPVGSLNVLRQHHKITPIANFNVQQQPIVRLMCADQNNILGLTASNVLFFVGAQGQPILCPKRVRQFYPVSSELVLTLSPNGYLSFMTAPSFSQLSSTSKLLPLPSETFYIADKLKKFGLQSKEVNSNSNIVNVLNNKDKSINNNVNDDNNENIDINNKAKNIEDDDVDVPHFSNISRDVWLVLKNKAPLRLKAAAAAAHDSGVFEEIVYHLLDKSNLDPAKKMELTFPSLLYANRFTEASDALLAVDVNEKKYLYCILLASLTVGFDKKIGEKQKTRLKMSALALFTTEKYEDGAMLLRLARLDRAAVDYLLESRQLDIAMRFVRSALEGEEKREMLLRCGGFLLQKGNDMKRAALFFAACGEFHPLLFVLFSLQEIADCFFIKRYAEKKGMLKPLGENIGKAVGSIMPLDEICHLIDAEFKSLLYHLDVDISLYYTE